MSGAETLRRAASEMRARAEAALTEPWSANGGNVTADVARYGIALICEAPRKSDAAHIASWHPAVALAVADWLDREATLHESLSAMGDLLNLAAKELDAGEIRLQFSDPGDQMAASTMPQALAVARAYLGESE